LPYIKGKFRQTKEPNPADAVDSMFNQHRVAPGFLAAREAVSTSEKPGLP